MKISEIIEELDYEKLVGHLVTEGRGYNKSFYIATDQVWRTRTSLQEQLIDFPIQSVCVRVAIEMILNHTRFKEKFALEIEKWYKENKESQINNLEIEIKDTEYKLEELREDLADLKGEGAEPHSGGGI